MNHLLKHRLLRRYLLTNAIGTITAFIFMAFWIWYYEFHPGEFIKLLLIPACWGFGRGIILSIKSIVELSSVTIDHAVELSLKLTDGRVSEKHMLPSHARGTCLVFFETSRNLIEGNVTLSQTVPPVVRETPILLKPGWRKIARGNYDTSPLEFPVSIEESIEVSLNFSLRIYCRSGFAASRAKSESVLILTRSMPVLNML